MSENLMDLTPESLVTAIEDNAFEFFAQFRGWPTAEFHAGSELMTFFTGIPLPLFNGVVRARLAPDQVDQAIEAVIARGRSKGVPLSWATGPSTRPIDLGEALLAHGFAYTGDNAGMAVDLLALDEAQPIQGALEIERVADFERLQVWCETGVTGFDLPNFASDAFFELFSHLGLDAHSPLQHYLGSLDGEPVATSSLLLGAGVAGIYNVATVEHARRKGIGAQVTLAPLLAARRLGYRVGILHASQMGAGVYRRLGFQEYCTISHYIWQGGPEKPES